MLEGSGSGFGKWDGEGSGHAMFTVCLPGWLSLILMIELRRAREVVFPEGDVLWLRNAVLQGCEML